MTLPVGPFLKQHGKRGGVESLRVASFLKTKNRAGFGLKLIGSFLLDPFMLTCGCILCENTC